MLNIKDLIGLRLWHSGEDILLGYILTQVGVDSWQGIRRSIRGPNETLGTIRLQLYDRMEPVPVLGSREIEPATSFTLRDPVSGGYLNTRHTSIDVLQISLDRQIFRRFCELREVRTTGS